MGFGGRSLFYCWIGEVFGINIMVFQFLKVCVQIQTSDITFIYFLSKMFVYDDAYWIYNGWKFGRWRW